MSRGRTPVRLSRACRLIVLPVLSFAVASAGPGTTPALAPPGAAEDPGAPPAGDAPAVRVVIDTLAVDGKGTRLVATDEADLLPGGAGVLEKSIALLGRGTARRRETVQILARVTPLPPPASGAACVVRIEVEAAPAGLDAAGRRRRSPEIVSATLALPPGEERLMDAYASAATEGKVVLKLRCGPAIPPASAGEEARLLTFNVTIERTADGEPPGLLRQQVLTAALGRSAVTAAGAHLSLPDGPGGERLYRSESLEVTLSPILVVAGRLQIDVRVSGEVATFFSGTDPARHPLESSGTFVVGPDDPRHIEIEVRSGEPDEGWRWVRFRVQVTGRF